MTNEQTVHPSSPRFARALARQVVLNPALAVKHAGAFLGDAGRIVRGKSEVVPTADDRRFTDPQWAESRWAKSMLQLFSRRATRSTGTPAGSA